MVNNILPLIRRLNFKNHKCFKKASHKLNYQHYSAANQKVK